jgi:hypothetical protein
LVRDNAELRSELALGDALRPGLVHRGALWSIATLGMFVFGVITGVALTLRATEPSWRSCSGRPVASAPSTTSMSTLELDACALSIGDPVVVTGTYRSSGDIARIRQSRAPCAGQLDALIVEGAWTPAQWHALDLWRQTEGLLGNTVSMIVREHESDPLGERDDPTATQLWHEYERARARRDAAVVMWRASH